MNKKLLIVLVILAVSTILFFIFQDTTTEEVAEIFVEAKRGDFKIEIVTTGELEAKNSVMVMGPQGLRQARLYRVEIQDIVDEGTIVKKGDYIAQLDRSELSDRLNNEQLEYEEALSEFTQTRLDTALDLRKARDELINLKFAVEEKKLILEQSQFEPPATIKQNEINFQRAKRELEQATQNYELRRQKAVAQMQERSAELRDEKREYEFIAKLSNDFLIHAPESGMVIYDREWDGRKKAEGSSISAWDPVVATLPDLTKMISRTYVNEVEIRKVQKGQPVDIGLDAYPEKKLTGEVTSVANIGEQRPNSDAKVFEVTIEVHQEDTTLRPAMTTSNTILVEEISNVVHVPLECLHSQGDSINYIFVRNNFNPEKREVRVGKTNANEAIIETGIEAGETLYLSFPVGGNELQLTRLEERGEPKTLESSVNP